MTLLAVEGFDYTIDIATLVKRGTAVHSGSYFYDQRCIINIIMQFGDDHLPPGIRVSGLMYGGLAVPWKRISEGSCSGRKLVTKVFGR